MDICDTSGRTSAGYQNGIDCLGFAEWKLKCLSKSVEKDRDVANRHPSPPGSCSDELRTLSMCWSLGGPLEGQPHHREVDPSVGSFQVSATEYRLPILGPLHFQRSSLPRQLRVALHGDDTAAACQLLGAPTAPHRQLTQYPEPETPDYDCCCRPQRPQSHPCDKHTAGFVYQLQ